MDIAPLNIKLVRQDPNSEDCLRTCALMVFRYYKDDISKDEIWRRLHVYKKHSGLRGAYAWDLGKLALKKGYGAEISHYDWQWWDKDTAEVAQNSKTKLLNALKRLHKTKRSWTQQQAAKKEAAFVKTGGNYTLDYPGSGSLDNYLANRIPVIIFTTTQDLFQNPNLNNLHDNHAVLVVGKKGDNYIVRDPFYAVSKVSSKHLLYSWHRAGGWKLAILPPKVKKKKVSPKIKQAQLKF